MTGDGYLTLDKTSARGVVSGVTGVSWQQCVSYNATGDDLAEYGLDTPSATATVRLTLDDVTGFDVTVDGETYSVTITRETVYDDDGNAAEEVTYTLAGGTEPDTETVDGALSTLNGMTGEGTATDRSGTELASFTFYQEREGYETVTLSFKTYNSSDCLTTLNGETGILAPMDSVQTAVDDLLAAFSGETGEEETEE